MVRVMTKSVDIGSNPDNRLVISKIFGTPVVHGEALVRGETIDPRATGGHPDIGERMIFLANQLPSGAAVMFGGRLTLINPVTNAVIAALAGTGYFLRLTDEHFKEAIEDGAQTIVRWNTSTWDLAEYAGPTWVRGRWSDSEPGWLLASAS